VGYIAGCRWYFTDRWDEKRAFTAKVVMLAGASRRVKVWDHRNCWDPAIGNCFAAEFGCEVKLTRMDQERKLYGASCCWFSG